MATVATADLAPAIVVCGRPELLSFDTIMNLVFKILSPSTAS